MEAIIGAIYEDGGPEAANAYVLKHFTAAMEAAVHGKPPKDAKSMLQEILQKNGPARIHYSLVGESGPDHAKVFTMAVFKGDTELGRGTDRSKKSAEFRAAQDALNKLNQR